MQNHSQQQDIPRGQSINFDSNRPFIYYYSVAKPLQENIVSELIICFSIKQSLMQSLPKIWFIMASSTAFVLFEKQPRFVTSNYILDMFIYSWLSDEGKSLKDRLTYKLTKLIVEQEKLDRLIDIFQSEIHQVIDEIKTRNPSNINMAYDNTCVQPLIVFQEKGKNENFKLIKRIEELNIDDDSNDSTLSSSQISQNLSFKEIDRSKSDIRDITATLQLNKMKKFTKQMGKMTESIFQQLILFNCQDEQQWQIARQFVVIILEMNVKSDHDIKTTEKVRFIQPALLFYKKALQVWILVKFSTQNKINFNQFLCKARNFFDKFWNDKFVLPLHSVFLVAESLHSELEGVDQTTKMSKFILLLREKLISQWQENLSICTKCLIQQ